MTECTTGLIGLAPRRKAKGYTQETFANALGVKRSRLAAWEVGYWPSAQWLPVMAELLGCGIGELYQPPNDIVPVFGGKDHAA